MSATVIIDIAIVVVLVGFMIYGTRRGLFQSLAGLLIVVLALFGAAMVAETFAPAVARIITPAVEKHFSQQLYDVLEEHSLTGGDSLTEPENGFLAELMEQTGTMVENAADTASAAISATAESLIESVAYGILFILSFILLLLLLRVLCAAMGLLTKLPGVHGLNALGGAAFGLVEGALLVFLAVYMLEKLGIAPHGEVWQGTHILKFFRENTPIEVLLSLLTVT